MKLQFRHVATVTASVFIALALAWIATLGLFELSMDHVKPAILIPVLIEVTLMLAFMAVGFSHSARPDCRRTYEHPGRQ